MQRIEMDIGCTRWIRSGVFIRNGSGFASGGGDGLISIWSRGGKKGSIKCGVQWINKLAVNGDGSLIACAGSDERTTIWGSHDLVLRHTLQPPRLYEGMLIEGASFPDQHVRRVLESLGAVTSATH